VTGEGFSGYRLAQLGHVRASLSTALFSCHCLCLRCGSNCPLRFELSCLSFLLFSNKGLYLCRRGHTGVSYNTKYKQLDIGEGPSEQRATMLRGID